MCPFSTDILLMIRCVANLSQQVGALQVAFQNLELKVQGLQTTDLRLQGLELTLQGLRAEHTQLNREVDEIHTFCLDLAEGPLEQFFEHEKDSEVASDVQDHAKCKRARTGDVSALLSASLSSHEQENNSEVASDVQEPANCKRARTVDCEDVSALLYASSPSDRTDSKYNSLHSFELC